MSFQRIAPLGAVLLLVPACQTRILAGKDTYSPSVQSRDYAQEKIDAGPRKGDVYGPGQRDPGASYVGTLTDALLAMEPRPKSVACLPFANHDLDAGHPWVSELGIATADSIASALREKGFKGEVLATNDVGLRMSQANLARTTFTTLDAVSANAERLGADVVVFGTIKRRNHAGSLERDVLTCDVQAYDVAGKRISASTRWEVPSDDHAFRQTWDLAQTESAWMPDSRHGAMSATPGLNAELQRDSTALATALMRTIDPAKVKGSVYVAPLDVGGFTPQTATLRAAQSAFATEITRRAEAAQAANTPFDAASPVVVDGKEFPNLQAAESYLAQLSEHFQSTPAARFALSFSSQLGDALRANGAMAGKSVNDLAAVRPLDRALVEGELAQGGLARSMGGRDALRTAGIGLVIVPRLEKVGDAIQIRADAYDIESGSITGSGTAALPANLRSELERALALEHGGLPSKPRPLSSRVSRS